MESNRFLRRIKLVFPLAALALVALVAVTTAMTILGDTQPNPTPAPSAGSSATPSRSSPVPAPTSPPPTYTPVATVRLPSTPPVVLTIYKGDHDPNRLWFVVWRYPQLRADSTPLASVVNQDISDEVTTVIETFEEGPAAQRQAPGKTNNLTGSYVVDMVAPDLASFTLKWIDDTAPGHPVIHLETLTYALNSGQRIDFSQLFFDMDAAVAIISQQAQIQLSRSLGKHYDPAAVAFGAAAVIGNFPNWSLTTAGLKVTFDEYQVGTAAAGLPSVVIPWSLLKGVMQPNGPAARLAGFATPT